MKVILFDIETSPLITYNWGTFQQNAIDIKDEWKLLSFAWKVLGSKEVFVETKEGQKSDKPLTKKLWKVLNEADVVIAHNGDAFDIKRANAKFLEHGLTPPRPFQSIDTLKIARNKFKLTSNRLDALAKLLGFTGKVNTGGFKLWLGCMSENPSSWALMAKYNRQDVVLLERVYLKLRPWTTKHPNLSAGLQACPKCKDGKLQSRGIARYGIGTFQRFRCNSCGGWCRSQKSVLSSQLPKQKVTNG